MPLWCNQDYIDRIVTRFKLEYSRRYPNSIPVDYKIGLSSDVDEILKTPHVAESLAVSIPALGYYTFHIVPANKLWRIASAQMAASTGTYKFSTLYVVDPVTSTRGTIFAASTPAPGILATFPSLYRIDGGWAIQAECNDWTLIGNAVMRLFYYEEDAIKR